MAAPGWLVTLRKMVGGGLLVWGAFFVAVAVWLWLDGSYWGRIGALFGLLVGLVLSALGLVLTWPGSRVARRASAACFLGAATALAILWWLDVAPFTGPVATTGGVLFAARALAQPPAPSAIT